MRLQVRHLSSFGLLVLLLLLISRQLPVWMNSSRHEGRVLPTNRYQLYYPERNQLTFPPPHQRSILIFWATWCTPCKLEMQRLRASVDAGKIPPGSVYAVNPFEPEGEILKFLTKESYPFRFMAAGDLAVELGVEVTPTTIFIDEQGTINSMASGLSVLGIWRAESFL
jgi:thiol-disulfide isomerase/thioredoxin